MHCFHITNFFEIIFCSATTWGIFIVPVCYLCVDFMLVSCRTKHRDLRVPRFLTLKRSSSKKENTDYQVCYLDYQRFLLSVGMTRFELATPRPPDAYSNRTELHPELCFVGCDPKSAAKLMPFCEPCKFFLYFLATKNGACMRCRPVLRCRTEVYSAFPSLPSTSMILCL